MRNAVPAQRFFNFSCPVCAVPAAVKRNCLIVPTAVLAILKARPGMGSLQLRKALIIADALHNALHGESITGVKYIKHKFGPVPDDEAFLFLMQMEFPLRLLEVIEEPVGHMTQNSYYPQKNRIMNYSTEAK